MVHSEESSSPNRAVNYSQHLESLENVGIYPSGELINGWFDDKNSVGEITLLYRTASVIPLAKFADWAQKETLDGRYIITHQLPVPTEWRHYLSDNGITCDSFMPPNGFSCRFTGVTLDQLADLSVLGIVKLDTVDKIRFGLAESLLDKRVVTLDVVLSGYELPSEINARDDIKVLDHSSRFATLDASLSGLKWLVLQDEIEWIEEKPVAGIVNSVANTIINSDDVRDNTKMAALSGAWSGLDGSGITVTVGDTGLDSGINDATMHPDFSDHILGIYSWPEPYSECTWNSPSDPGPCDDGADDDNGHGTHVAGSVLGDGTASSGSVMGIAPEAQLLVHAFEQNGGLGGIPNDYQDFFDVAVENNSRIHTNSWGSCNRPNKHAPCNDYGLYSTGSMQIDMGALTHKQLVILFANGNDAEDGDGNGEIDENSMLWEATAKNSISIGASENYRPSRGPAADNAEGMASFSGRGPTEDGRIKPDFVAPGTHIYSTKSRAAGPAASSCGWGSDSSITDYCFMGGTSMATPIAAGATALLLEHLIENEGVTDPTSYLVKAILGASTTDMAGQFGSPTNGAGEAIPNMHEGNGRLNMYSAVQTSFVHNESLSTTDDRGWSFTLPNGAHDLQVALAYADPAATPAVTPYLVNDLDLSLTDPTGTVHDLNDNLNNLRVMNISSPIAGTWEVHVVGTNVPSGPQFFSLAINHDVPLVNLTLDADLDGVEDSVDDCMNVAGTSSLDRSGCPDTDSDGYSDPDSGWGVVNGADAFINDPTQWADQDSDSYGDNPLGVNPDGCPVSPGTSTLDRFGCADGDGDGYSDPDGGWPISSGADSCPTVAGTSNQDRYGCPDDDSDGYSDPDPSGNNGPSWGTNDGADAFIGNSTQWVDADGDSFGDNPTGTFGDACVGTTGSSFEDRFGCVDSDGDGWSNPTSGWTAANGADAFIAEITQWADQDGDGYGDNPAGVNPDSCPSIFGTSNQLGILGCSDTDNDGYADIDDLFPNDASQWEDGDNDGYGDNPGGNNPDACIGIQGFSSQDRFGCLDTDGDGFSDGDNGWTIANGADMWPNDVTQWIDSDGDGYGDNASGTNGDMCPAVNGASTNDRIGCLDSDGDGWSDPSIGWTASDGADAFPSDSSRWADADGDGVDDASDDDCPGVEGYSSIDRQGCPDSDGDGYSDSDDGWTYADGADVFPNDDTQWRDSDSDGYGDEENGNDGDSCPNTPGDSWRNGKLGCPDNDGDGWANEDDAQPNEPTQWSDSDGDNYGDNLAGVNPDACPYQYGNSTLGNRLGCPDSDGDGWDDIQDELPNNATQWLDGDGDGWGDNAFGIDPDSCPTEPGTSSVDRKGCPDNDGDGISNLNDAFPDDPTRSQDTDGDGFDDMEDNCIFVAGNSSQDRIGCPDADGDGYSDVTLPTENAPGWNIIDGADAFPAEPSQWADQDSDGFGDNVSGFQADDCPAQTGYSNNTLFGCPDDDNDGWAQSIDDFPEDNTQWSDSDGDGYGDNPEGINPDGCPNVVGSSTLDQFGCPDEDNDGASDENDLWIGDNTQWFDSDLDSFGDNEAGTNGDSCPEVFGTAFQGTKHGCPDSDTDGWADIEDAFPDQESQWLDSDGDGWGDNQTGGAHKLDHWPNDPTRNAGQGELSCNNTVVQLDLAGGDWFTFTCTISSEMTTAGIELEWQAISGISADTNFQTVIFTPELGNSRVIVFSGEVMEPGEYQLIISATEIGAEFAMDSVSVTLDAQDSRLASNIIDDQTDTINRLLKKSSVQASLGALLLMTLMGLLYVRGKASAARRNKERREHAQSILKARLSGASNSPEHRRLEFGLNRQIPPPPPGYE